MAADSPSSVYLHVGLAKSGTTYLQDCLWSHRDVLGARGMTYPGPHKVTQFRAAVDLRGKGEAWGMTRVEGTWDWLAGLVCRAPGDALLSHEVLAACTPDQVRRAADSFGDRTLHVVVTARDLGRQAVAHWQESVKNGSTTSFAEFADAVVETSDPADRSGPFWTAQGLDGVLDRWSGVVPPDRLHVLPVQSNGAPEALWHAFGEVIGVDTTDLPPPSGRGNPSLGRGEVALLRRVNLALDGRIEQPAYRFVVKRFLAQRVLPGRSPDRLRLTPGLRDALAGPSEAFVARVREGGFAVHGDLANLVLQPEATSTDQDDVDPSEAHDLAVEVLAEVLEEVARLRDSVTDLRREVGAARRETAEVRREAEEVRRSLIAEQPPGLGTVRRNRGARWRGVLRRVRTRLRRRRDRSA